MASSSASSTSLHSDVPSNAGSHQQGNQTATGGHAGEPIPGVWVSRAFVAGLPQTYDPSTYDPENPVPGTPPPEPYEPETYEAWGHERFGDNWLEIRRRMIEERSLYLRNDLVYESRQRELRIIEHVVERRPFRPAIKGGHREVIEENFEDEAWKQLWERLKRELPREEVNFRHTVHGFIPRAPSPYRSPPPQGERSPASHDRPPSPPAPPPTPPCPYDPIGRMKWERRLRQKYSDGQNYQFKKIFLAEDLVDRSRSEKEDEESEVLRNGIIRDIEEFRQPHERYDIRRNEVSMRRMMEYERQMRRFNRLGLGKTPEQIEAEDRAADEAAAAWRPPITDAAQGLQELIDNENRTAEAAGLPVPTAGALAFQELLDDELATTESEERPLHPAETPLFRALHEALTDPRRRFQTLPQPSRVGSNPVRRDGLRGSEPKLLPRYEEHTVAKDARGRPVCVYQDGRLRDSKGRFRRKPDAPTRKSKKKRPRKARVIRPEPAETTPEAPAAPPEPPVSQPRRSSRRLANLAPEHGTLQREPRMTKRRRRPKMPPIGQIQGIEGRALLGDGGSSGYLYHDDTYEPLAPRLLTWRDNIEP